MDVNQLLLAGSGLRLRDLAITPDMVAITVESTASIAECPGCRSTSERIHGRYLRTVGDLPCQGRRVMLRLVARRFRCNNAACPRQTFAEPLRSIAPYARGTIRLTEIQRAFGFALGGEAGARLATLIGLPASPDTLLRRIRQTIRHETPPPRVLGIDDFAFRKGQTYGTILVDLQRRRVVDLLPDREAATMSQWLRSHPGVEVITRDRASAYSRAASESAPEAVQVADRWHLLSNMRDALERILQQRSAMISNLFRKRSEDESVDRPASAIEPPAKAREERHRARIARFDEVKTMFAAGHSMRGIAAALDMHYETVVRYVRSDVCPDWRVGCRRPSRLDRFADTIEQRLRAGCRNTCQILRELHEMGYRGGKTAGGDYVRRLEGELGISPRSVGPLSPRAEIPSARRLAVSAVRRPDQRSGEDRQSLDDLRENDCEIKEAIDLAASFAALVRGRRPDDLNVWLIRAEASSVAGLRSFARRLRQDETAVRAGVTVEWSNGPVEGHVSRLKFLKRSMYGRARFDLLKARVLDAR